MDFKRERPDSASSQHKQNIPSQTGTMEEYIIILYEHQKACERGRKYVEAQAAKLRIEELRKNIEGKSKGEIRNRHHTEKQEIDKVHMDEFNQFNEFWDNKMSEFDQEAIKFRESTLERHLDEVKLFIDELEQSIPMNPKDSGELIGLRRTEEQLAKQESYIEAHKIQQRIRQVQTEEQDKWGGIRFQKIKNLVQQIKQKQSLELNAVQQRIISGQDEQRKVRSLELEKLLQKYNNVKKELESQQNLEVNRLDKSQKNQSIMQQSRMNQSRMNEQNNTHSKSQNMNSMQQEY